MMGPKNRYNVAYTLRFADGRPDKTDAIKNVTDDSEAFLLRKIAVRESALFEEVEFCYGSIYPIVAPYKTARLFSYGKDEIKTILNHLNYSGKE